MAGNKTADLADKVCVALRAAFSDLLAENGGQQFYAFGLWTDDSLQFLHPVANSEEALAATVERYRKEVDPKLGGVSTRYNMRWAYGDWGFFPDVGGKYFDEINSILQENFNSPMDIFASQIESLWQSVLDGFVQLESQGFFGTGELRSKITLMVVGHVPEERVDQWVSELNPPAVAEQWLNWDYNAPDINL
ncbi:MAG: hypothetical protein QG657_438 [Acidobacteriota bacterium]|nr:hypothetical protein [Acidobacteriota bacterium]